MATREEGLRRQRHVLLRETFRIGVQKEIFTHNILNSSMIKKIIFNIHLIKIPVVIRLSVIMKMTDSERKL